MRFGSRHSDEGTEEEDFLGNDKSSSASCQGEWFEIQAIIGEKSSRYKVNWKGLDPATGEPWKPEWVSKSLVTEDAIREWEDKKRQRKKKPKRKGKWSRRTLQTPEPEGLEEPLFAIVIRRSEGFRPSEYARFDPGDISIAPCSQGDFEDCSSDSSDIGDDSAFFTKFPHLRGRLRRRDSPRVIPDSQPNDHDLPTSSFLQQDDTPPPPSYLETISQSTQKSVRRTQSQLGLVEVAVQTSPPRREDLDEYFLEQDIPPDKQQPQEREEEFAEQADNLGFEETFDLDYPDRRSESPCPFRRLSLPRQTGSDQGTPRAEARDEQYLTPGQEVAQKQTPGDEDHQAIAVEETLEKPSGAAYTEAGVKQLSSREDEAIKAYQSIAAVVQRRRARRRQITTTIKLECWFGRDPIPQLVSPELLSSSPPDSILPYPGQYPPFPPPETQKMSHTSSLSLPARPGSLREKMEARKREMEEALANRSSASRSSSIAPQIGATLTRESLPNITQRSDTAEAPNAAPRMAQGRRISNISSSAFGPPILGAMEYAICLPLGHESINDGISQEEVYRQEILKKHADIDVFLSLGEKAAQDVQRSAFDLLRSAALIATHPHLVYSVAALGVSDEKQAEYHVLMSSKFRFLRDLFAVIKEENIKIAIVAENGKLIDMLEIFFRGIKIAHKRLDKLSVLEPISEDDVEGMAQVFIVPSKSRSGVVASQCHVVIAMDSTFDPQTPEVTEIRQNVFQPTKLAPVLRIVAANTIEHALLCVSPSFAQRLYVCVEAMKALRDIAGVVDPAYQAQIGSTAHTVGRWIARRSEGELKISAMPEIPLFESAEFAQRQDLQVEHIDNGEKRKRQDSLMGSQASKDAEAKKRRLIEEASTSTEPARPLGEGDTTQVSSTTPSPASPSSTAGNQMSLPTSNGAEPNQEDDDQEAPMDLDDNETESEPEPELAYVSARPVIPTVHLDDRPLEGFSHAELVDMLKQRNEELEGWMASQARLQTRFEELQQALREYKAKNRDHERSVKSANTRRDRALADVEKLQEQKATLNTQIHDAMQLLKTTNPELSALVTENAELKQKLEQATNKLSYAEKEAEFVREQYQNASKAMYDVRKEFDDLQQQNVILQRKADERVVTLRAMANQQAIQARDQQIEELIARNKEMEQRCAKLMTREGAYTFNKRGSVPRRVGSPAQSRGSSPSVASRRAG
ncbi:class II histone deacetylase complex subunits 2 and 3-domain-containing protein [Sphaerosporella brunnea]|uniref:Class II histone deacetylase complex subunits 2 and 3-domain-containing protein n=1 Tax=Sphaerosporella brunnea TaxID=1250544 RepID=A0A5J5EQP1_9PEZI|nr:class II histone deacetylase complex subunits 2 and 3-domain-containing protein [Sphaerosporella brunnea]